MWFGIGATLAKRIPAGRDDGGSASRRVQPGGGTHGVAIGRGDVPVGSWPSARRGAAASSSRRAAVDPGRRRGDRRPSLWDCCAIADSGKVGSPSLSGLAARGRRSPLAPSAPVARLQMRSADDACGRGYWRSVFRRALARSGAARRRVHPWTVRSRNMRFAPPPWQPSHLGRVRCSGISGPVPVLSRSNGCAPVAVPSPSNAWRRGAISSRAMPRRSACR